MRDPSSRSNQNVTGQRRVFEDIVASSPLIALVLARAPELGVSEWYLGAGCVAGTVWNFFHGFDPSAHIKDIDVVYYERSDLSLEAEDRIVQRASALFADLSIPVEVKNQARVHLWYEDRFGHPIPPYESLEEAIETWPTTATSIGIRRDQNGTLLAYAPFGLSDLFTMIVRPNKRQVTKEVYCAKVQRWRRHWPKLTIIPWDQPFPYE